MKKCSACQMTKLASDFHQNAKTKDGLAQDCRSCHNARVAAYYQRTKARKAETKAAWKAANADRIKAQAAAYRAANAEKIKAYNLEYQERTREDRKAKYRANPEPAKARARAWTAANTELVMERNRKWRADNPDRYREHMRMGRARRRARLAELPTYDVTAKDMRRLLASPCAVTGCNRTDIQIDHVIPVARGGSHGVGNFQPLCSSHNQSKGKRLWIEFRAYLALKERLAA